MGTPEIGAMVFEQLICSGLKFSACLTRPDKPQGRIKKIAPSPVKIVAEKHHIPIYQPSTKNELALILRELKLDLAIVAAYGVIIPAEALKAPTYGIINFHPSLLPLYRGPSPITAPILNGDKITGVTIIKLSERMDEGDILDQKELLIDKKDTTPTLSTKLAVLGSKMIMDLVPKIVNQKAETRAQTGETTYTSLVKKNDGLIDWNKETADQIERKSRAYDPWPGIHTYFKQKKLDLYGITARPLPSSVATKLGTVIKQNDEIGIIAREGLVFPTSVKIEGKNKVTISEFARGYQDFIGSTLKLNG